MQFVGHEEGRIRFKPANNSFQYDYMVKDHLGNTRMVLTEEQQTDSYPAATMEPAAIASESTYYGNLANKPHELKNSLLNGFYHFQNQIALAGNKLYVPVHYSFAMTNTPKGCSKTKSVHLSAKGRNKSEIL